MRSREEIDKDLEMNCRQIDSPSTAALHLIAEALFDLRDLLQNPPVDARRQALDDIAGMGPNEPMPKKDEREGIIGAKGERHKIL